MRWGVKRAPRAMAVVLASLATAWLTLTMSGSYAFATTRAATHGSHREHGATNVSGVQRGPVLRNAGTGKSAPIAGSGSLSQPPCVGSSGESCAGPLHIRVQNGRGKPVSGADVSLYISDGERLVDVASCTTGGIKPADSACTFVGLAYGKYVVVQTSSPAGHADATHIDLECDCTTSVVLTDTSGVGRTTTPGVLVHKTDAYGNPLPGATFELFTVKGRKPGLPTGITCTTADKHATASCMLAPAPTGRYYVVETEAPSGYGLAPARLVVVGQRTVLVRFKDLTSSSSGAIFVRINDNKGIPMPDVGITLYSQKSGHIGLPAGSACTTQMSGKIASCTLDGIAPGHYVLREDQAPVGFQDSKNHTVTVLGGLLTTTRFDDHIVPGTGALLISRFDSLGAPIPPSVFTIWRDDNGQLGSPTNRSCATSAAENSAACEIGGLVPGSYYVVETSDSGGPATASPLLVTSKCNKTVRVTFNDARLTRHGQVTVTTENPQHDPLTGAGYTLWTEDKGSPAYATPFGCQSGTASYCTIGDAPLGQFLLEETTAPVGYLSAAPVGVNVAFQGTEHVTVIDQPSPQTGGGGSGPGTGSSGGSGPTGSGNGGGQSGTGPASGSGPGSTGAANGEVGVNAGAGSGSSSGSTGAPGASLASQHASGNPDSGSSSSSDQIQGAPTESSQSNPGPAPKNQTISARSGSNRGGPAPGAVLAALIILALVATMLGFGLWKRRQSVTELPD